MIKLDFVYPESRALGGRQGNTASMLDGMLASYFDSVVSEARYKLLRNRKIMMINLKDKSISHLLAHKGVQLSHLESQQIEILSHELSCAHCKLLSGFRLVEI